MWVLVRFSPVGEEWEEEKLGIPGFLSAFCSRGRKIRLYGLLGEQVHICVQSVQQARGGVQGRAPPGNFDFGPFIRRNLVESGTVVAQT